jgi:short-chain fatty acids transporter
MQRLARFFVRIFEQATPDPYVFAVGLTLVTALLAVVFAPHHEAGTLLGGWYRGIFDILTFAFQMILILVTGYALASSRPVTRLLEALASLPRSPRSAVATTFLLSAAACWLNWGFGLVVAGLLARTIAARMKIDFGWLVAAAYAGFIVWASGLSSSIALAQATPGSALNIVARLTGHTLPLSRTIFAPFNLVPVIVLLVLLPLLLVALQPSEQDVLAGNLPELRDGSSSNATENQTPQTLARTLENAWILNLVLVAAGFAYLATTWARSGFELDIDIVMDTLINGAEARFSAHPH